MEYSPDTITLLVFSLDADYGCTALSSNGSSIAVSGGVLDFWGRKAAWNWGMGTIPSDGPFLRYAPSWLVESIVWGLIGHDARLYVMFSDAAGAARAYGLDNPVANGDMLARYTITMDSDSCEDRNWIWPTFFDVTADAVALGFAGSGMTELERRLIATPSIVIADGADSWPESHRLLDSELFEASLSSCVLLNGLASVSRSAPLVLLPYGHEKMDGLFYCSGMRQTEMIERTRDAFGERVTIIEFAGSDAFRAWSRDGTLPSR